MIPRLLATKKEAWNSNRFFRAIVKGWSWRSVWTHLQKYGLNSGCSCEIQELDSVILMGCFQFRIFCDSVIFQVILLLEQRMSSEQTDCLFPTTIHPFSHPSPFGDTHHMGDLSMKMWAGQRMLIWRSSLRSSLASSWVNCPGSLWVIGRSSSSDLVYPFSWAKSSRLTHFSTALMLNVKNASSLCGNATLSFQFFLSIYLI